jgi:hypothetical protein
MPRGLVLPFGSLSQGCMPARCENTAWIIVISLRTFLNLVTILQTLHQVSNEFYGNGKWRDLIICQSWSVLMRYSQKLLGGVPDCSLLFVDLNQKPFLTSFFNNYDQRKTIEGDCDFRRCPFRGPLMTSITFYSILIFSRWSILFFDTNQNDIRNHLSAHFPELSVIRDRGASSD